MAENFSNFYSSQIMAAVDGDDPFLIVLDAAGAPSAPSFRIVVQDGADDITNRELMNVVSVQSGTTFQVTRGIEGTSGASHVSGSFVAHVLTAGVLAELQHDEWAAYTVNWTTTGTAPSIGNGTLSGRHKDIDSHTCVFRIYWAAGSTTTFGTGTWRFNAPHNGVNLDQNFDCRLLDQGTDNKLGTAYLGVGNDILEIIGEGTNVVTNTTPHTWANTDTLSIQGVMEY